MELRELVKELKTEQVIGNTQLKISGIQYDSRQIEDNHLFIAITGFNQDGHNFIENAIKNGAKAVLIERELEYYRPGICYILVKDSRKVMSFLAARFYRNPQHQLSLIGVTGTNGKTTTTYLIRAILEQAGIKTGLIGTIQNIIGEQTLPATRTTPESLDLYRLFAQMVDVGITHVVMEVSSHALDLNRVEGMDFQVAVFTNITQDHLDYHHSLAEYLEAKSRLFKQLKGDGYAVINSDDPHAVDIIRASRGQVITYAIDDPRAEMTAQKINLAPDGVYYQLAGRRDFALNLNLTGFFNVYNSLAAITCGHVLALSDQVIKSGLEKVMGVAGRFELVKEGQDFSVVVDYAHTSDGMENVLQTALEFVKGKIIVVFGAGGDRDKGKRPLMGQMAARYADYSILTSDNPRSEDPLLILRDIEQGIKAAEREAGYAIIPDREKAIYNSIARAKKGDMVIIFGKGHETYQVFKDKTISFDDREVARAALRQRLGSG